MKQVRLYIPDVVAGRIRKYHSLSKYVDSCIKDCTSLGVGSESVMIYLLLKRGESTRVMVSNSFDDPSYLRLKVRDRDVRNFPIRFNDYLCAGVTELANIAVIDCLTYWDVEVNGEMMNDDDKILSVKDMVNYGKRGSQWSCHDYC